MTHGYKIYNQSLPYYLTLQIVQWIDVFTRKLYRDIIIDSLKFCQHEKDLEIYAYVIMSNHIHLLAKSNQENLSHTIGDFKSFTCKEIIKSIQDHNESRRIWLLSMFQKEAENHKRNQTYQIWTHDNHPEEIQSNHFIKQKVQYIHNNPVRAGIVINPEDYLYSSARNYAGLDYLLEVTKVDI